MSDINPEMEFYHDPVMLPESIEALRLESGEYFADCTLGGGGHSEAFLRLTDGKIKLTSFDRDPEAIAHATERLKQWENFTPIYSTFSTLAENIHTPLDGIFADLGVSSRQLDNRERGFSFRFDHPIDLRMNTESAFTARDYLLETDDKKIAKALSFNSDIPKAYRLAARLKTWAEENELLMPAALEEILLKVFPRERDRKGMTARVLQAIRMEINSEIYEIETLVEAALKTLKPGGRLVFLTYHSVEDRTVKRAMQDLIQPPLPNKNIPLKPEDMPKASFKKIARKPLPPSQEEIDRNPRARSAKLRSYERLSD